MPVLSESTVKESQDLSLVNNDTDLSKKSDEIEINTDNYSEANADAVSWLDESKDDFFSSLEEKSTHDVEQSDDKKDPFKSIFESDDDEFLIDEHSKSNQKPDLSESLAFLNEDELLPDNYVETTTSPKIKAVAHLNKFQFPTSSISQSSNRKPASGLRQNKKQVPSNAFDLPTELVSETSKLSHIHHQHHLHASDPVLSQANHNKTNSVPPTSNLGYFQDTSHTLNKGRVSIPLTGPERGHSRNASLGSHPSSTVYRPQYHNPYGSYHSAETPFTPDSLQMSNLYNPIHNPAPVSKYDPRNNVTKPPIALERINTKSRTLSGTYEAKPSPVSKQQSAFGDMPADIGFRQADMYKSAEAQQAIMNARRHSRSASSTASSPQVYSQKSDSGIISNEALLKRQFPIFNWGMGGKIVRFLPPPISFGISTNFPEIKINSSSDILTHDPTLSKFPFNLVSAKGPQKNKALEGWIVSHISSLENAMPQDDVNRITVWKILLALIQDESTTQNPSETLKTAIRQILDPHVQVVSSEPSNNSFAPVIDIYHRNLHRRTTSIGTHHGKAVQLSSENINTLADLIKLGERKKALKYSLDNRLWVHALIIASSLSPQEWVSSVAEFVREEIREFPSQSARDLSLMYRIFSGAGGDSSKYFFLPDSMRIFSILIFSN